MFYIRSISIWCIVCSSATQIKFICKLLFVVWLRLGFSFYFIVLLIWYTWKWVCVHVCSVRFFGIRFYSRGCVAVAAATVGVVVDTVVFCLLYTEMHGKIQSPLSVIATELCIDMGVNGNTQTALLFFLLQMSTSLFFSFLCSLFRFCYVRFSFLQFSWIELEPFRGFVLRT